MGFLIWKKQRNNLSRKLIKRPRITAKDIIDRLISNYHYDCQEWACIKELRIGTGYGGMNESRVDLFCINCWQSKGNIRVAYEVKVSKQDFLKEIARPLKRAPALMISNQFYFATPPGLCDPNKIPLEAGLIEIDENGQCNKIIDAIWRDTYPPTWPLLASIARRKVDTNS